MLKATATVTATAVSTEKSIVKKERRIVSDLLLVQVSHIDETEGEKN